MIQVGVTAQNPVSVGVSGSLVQIPGPSAYEVAVSNGFTGTQAQWLLSLVGPTGAQGATGANGVSPTVTVTAISGGHRITVTDGTGSSSFDVMDGLDGTGTGDMRKAVYSPNYTGELADKAALDALSSIVEGHTDALGGHSVGKSVPADAVFTDTVYDDTALGARVDAVEELIPTQAGSDNQLADKSFVNSSVSTATAEFRGTYGTLALLEAVTADNNDYGFVVTTDSVGNTVYRRYKFDGTSWAFEYDLNNSSFTAAQWGAIQSGATAAIIGSVSGKEDTANRVTAITASSTDSSYPTAKAVWELFDSIAIYNGEVE